jgi:PAS domain S-box-containing protein
MAKTSARVRTGDELAEAALIIASSHDAIVGMNRTGTITSCNPAAARLYGAAVQDILGRPAEMLIPPERREEEAALVRRIVAGEEVEQFFGERLRVDGSVVKVSTSLSPIVDAAGRVIGAATATRRISDLQQASDRFEVRVEQHRSEVRDASARLELRAHLQRADAQHASDRFEAQVGVERKQASVAAVRFEEQIEAERREASAASDRFEEQVGLERQEASDAVVRFEAQMDLERQEASAAVDRFEAEVDQERIHVRDAQSTSQLEMAAERAEAQRDKDHLQAQLQQNQRLEVLGQLAGGVAHDFNNLLAVILNYAAFVAEELAATAQSESIVAARADLGQIERAAQRATALTHQLLAFARREVVRPRVLDLNDVVTEVQQLLERTIGEDIVLHTDLADDLWPVLADAGQVEQVLVNLAINARDAMSDGGTLAIDTANILVGGEFIAAGSPLRAGRYVRLRIGDTGTGMPADVMAHVFEPFYTTKVDGTGTGLGLATVYGIVRQADATIDIRSQPGVGTTFTILIPASDEAVLPLEEEVAYQHVPTGETVLVVEDEEALREVTERIFTRSGYHVITAANGAEALTIAAEYDGEIHLLLTDVVMPNMLGKEVAEKVLRIRGDIKVLYMSGYAQPVLASRGRLDRDVHLIEKPFSAATLIAKAGQILQ